jgi:hypothetical protein
MFDLIEWITYGDMTEKEKKEKPFAEHTGGYIKTYKYQEAFCNAFENAKIEDLKKTLELPNFDYDIFEEISGISKADFQRRLGNICEDDEIIIINGFKYKKLEN